MPFNLNDKLVVAIASSALFDLSESAEVFRTKGEAEYRRHQRENEDVPFGPGVAFPFVRRLLALNLDPAHAELLPVEVILLSNNDPDTGLRVMNSIQHHGLGMTRGAFVSGNDPTRYIEAYNACLFLSADEDNVMKAILNNHPAGRVLESSFADDPNDKELRIAFDFDGVLIDDEAEKIFQASGLEAFQEQEVARALTAHNPGPLKRLLEIIAQAQRREIALEESDPNYKRCIRTAIVTSRNAPAHKRMVTTLRAWGITIDETFFMGGIDKNRVLATFRPHIFFDDQLGHAGPAARVVPAVHVPFGIVNTKGIVI